MFTLSIVTPERVVFERPVKSLVVPGSEGYLGVLSHHAPLITALQPGKIEFADAQDKVHVMAVSGGFLEVSHNSATILADTVERADEIDLARAEAAYERGRAHLVSVSKGEISADLQAVQEALERARNRIRIYKETH